MCSSHTGRQAALDTKLHVLTHIQAADGVEVTCVVGVVGRGGPTQSTKTVEATLQRSVLKGAAAALGSPQQRAPLHKSKQSKNKPSQQPQLPMALCQALQHSTKHQSRVAAAVGGSSSPNGTIPTSTNTTHDGVHPKPHTPKTTAKQPALSYMTCQALTVWQVQRHPPLIQ
jgi:hypothetical protein